MAKGKEDATDTIETISAAGDEQQQQQIQLQIDDSQTPLLYSTTVRVWGSSEEINLDFAGPIRPGTAPRTARLKIDQRVVLNPWAAKRLAVALGQAVGRYEATYGTLELDERRRRVAGAPTAGVPTAAATGADPGAGAEQGDDDKKKK